MEPIIHKTHYINSIVSRFENGEERYKNSALVHNVIESLIHGADPIETIDKLCTMYEELSDRHMKTIQNLSNL